MPFVRLLNAQDPPVTGVFVENKKKQSPGYQSGGLVRQCKDRGVFTFQTVFFVQSCTFHQAQTWQAC